MLFSFSYTLGIYRLNKLKNLNLVTKCYCLGKSRIEEVFIWQKRSKISQHMHEYKRQTLEHDFIRQLSINLEVTYVWFFLILLE